MKNILTFVGLKLKNEIMKTVDKQGVENEKFLGLKEAVNSIDEGVIRNPETLVLFRKNLIYNSLNKRFVDIEFNDFRIDRKPMLTASLILFIDDDGNSKLLKSRWGKTGNVK